MKERTTIATNDIETLVLHETPTSSRLELTLPKAEVLAIGFCSGRN